MINIPYQNANPYPVKTYDDTQQFIINERPEFFTFIYRPHKLKSQAQNFIQHFPGDTLYAVKCNPEPFILQDLIASGIVHFDVASQHEIELLNQQTGHTHPFFMHPIKPRNAIGFAWENGVRNYVIDHQDELEKMRQCLGNNLQECRIFVRMSLPDLGSLIDLSCKFGAPSSEVSSLLQSVEKSACETGLSFHVGTQISSPKAFVTAIGLAANAIHQSKVECRHLDIGGGFPGVYVNDRPPPLQSIISDIKQAFIQNNIHPQTTTYCEPGRAMVSDCMSLIVQIHARYGDQIFINAGRYHGMLEMAMANIEHPVKLFRNSGIVERDISEMERFIVQGATCDSLDKLLAPVLLPKDAQEGDWLEFGQVGSYSSSLLTNFNGIQGGEIVICNDLGPAVI